MTMKTNLTIFHRKSSWMAWNAWSHKLVFWSSRKFYIQTHRVCRSPSSQDIMQYNQHIKDHSIPLCWISWFLMPMHAEDTPNNKHDQCKPVNLPAIFREIEESIAYLNAIFSTLFPATYCKALPNGAVEAHSPAAAMITQQLITKILPAIPPYMMLQAVALGQGNLQQCHGSFPWFSNMQCSTNGDNAINDKVNATNSANDTGADADNANSTYINNNWPQPLHWDLQQLSQHSQLSN